MIEMSTVKDLGHIFKRLAAMKRILIALDFDGTVSNIVDDPEGARMTQQARFALTNLGGLDGLIIALISGRSLDSLARVARPVKDWLLVGSHGVEFSWESSAGDHSSKLEIPMDLVRSFEDITAKHCGSRLEKKPFGLALHTRALGQAESKAVEDMARQVVAEWEQPLLFRVGKGVVEFSTREGTKAEGIAALKKFAKPDVTLFAGDDLTDEDGFRALSGEDIGIRVGHGSTVAEHRLPNVESVAQMLEIIYSERCKQFAL